MRAMPHGNAAAQITTCRGVVSGRLRSQQRQLEVELMRFCFRKLGALPHLSCLANLLRPSCSDKPRAHGAHLDTPAHCHCKVCLQYRH